MEKIIAPSEEAMNNFLLVIQKGKEAIIQEKNRNLMPLVIISGLAIVVLLVVVYEKKLKKVKEISMLNEQSPTKANAEQENKDAINEELTNVASPNQL